jgi:hypothetical protein
MGEFKSLNQALLFQLSQVARLGQRSNNSSARWKTSNRWIQRLSVALNTPGS